MQEGTACPSEWHTEALPRSRGEGGGIGVWDVSGAECMREGTACPSESATLARQVLHTSVGGSGVGGGAWAVSRAECVQGGMACASKSAALAHTGS